MHVSFSDRLHFTFDCLQFSQAVRSFGVSPLLEGALDSLSIEGHGWFQKLLLCKGGSVVGQGKGKRTTLWGPSAKYHLAHCDYIYAFVYILSQFMSQTSVHT